jgi:flagellar protein FlaD
MSEENQNKGEKPLEEYEISAELATYAEQSILSRKIAQRIGEKLKQKNIRITREQLLKLVEKIQNTIQTYSDTSSSSPEQIKRGEIQVPPVEKNSIVDDTVIQVTDMKKLTEMVERLSERLKVIEENRLEGVKGVTGKLVKTKDIKTLEQTNASEEDLQPLEHIPTDPESIVVLMKWLQYLVDRTGKNNLGEVLGYYVDIGWISDDVRLDLIDYAKGITDVPTQQGTTPHHLPTKDHLQSLLFIQKLKGLQLDDRFLNKIERDMEKMVKSLEGYQLK